MSPVEPTDSAMAAAGPAATANTVSRSDAPARDRFFTPERICLAVLLAIFAGFTWRGLLSFYSGDDVMNTYWAWTWNHKDIAWANLLVWKPVYRPLGEILYLAFYAAFGFQPTPLYIFCWLLLIANVFAVYAMFRALFSTAGAALTALALTLVHGAYTPDDPNPLSTGESSNLLPLQGRRRHRVWGHFA